MKLSSFLAILPQSEIKLKNEQWSKSICGVVLVFFFMFIVLCKRLEPPFLSLFFASNESDFLVTLLSTWDIFFKFLVFEHFQRNVLLFVELLYNDQFYIFRHVVTSSKNTFVPIYLTKPLKNLHKIRQLDMHWIVSFAPTKSFPKS